MLLLLSMNASKNADLLNTFKINCRIAFYYNRGERVGQLLRQPDFITTSIDEVSTTAKPLVRQIRNLPAKMKKLMEMLPHQEA